MGSQVGGSRMGWPVLEPLSDPPDDKQRFGIAFAHFRLAAEILSNWMIRERNRQWQSSIAPESYEFCTDEH